MQTHFISLIPLLALPKILNFNMERTARLTLEAQINHLTTENENLRKKLDDAKRDIDSLHVRNITSGALYILNMFLFGTES
jgi:hypothetical protein